MKKILLKLTYVNAAGEEFRYNNNNFTERGKDGMNQIEQFARETLGITDESVIEMANQHARIRNVAKWEYLINAGDVVTEINFLVSGLFRGCFMDSDGNEITDCFGYLKGTPANSATDFTKPAPCSLQALEDSVVISFPIDQVMHLLETNVEVVHLYRRLVSWSIEAHWDNKMALHRFTAAEKYEWFLKEYEGLIDRVPHVHIASFLGMTPVTLSRLRGELKKKQQENE